MLPKTAAAETALRGSSPVMQRVREEIATVAGLDWHVRLEGPRGTGKTIAARLLHDLSHRAMAPFVLCSLAMLPDGAEISELVGHRRGAFTSAVEDRVGKAEQAHTGTLFLEELATASPHAQAVLLQIVDGAPFTRLGENRPRTVNVRCVSASNEDLEAMVAQGRFRVDLYDRLGLLLVRLPALCEHREDIPDLAEYVLVRLCGCAGRPVPLLPSEAVELLVAFDWPGNVRQLTSVLQYFVAFERLPDVVVRTARGHDWRERLDEVLHKHEGEKAPAAQEMGVSRETLYQELRRRQG